MVRTVSKVIELARKKSEDLEKVCREKLGLEQGQKPNRLWNVYKILRKQQITLSCQIPCSQKQNRAIVHQILKVCFLFGIFLIFWLFLDKS